MLFLLHLRERRCNTAVRNMFLGEMHRSGPNLLSLRQRKLEALNPVPRRDIGVFSQHSCAFGHERAPTGIDQDKLNIREALRVLSER